MEANSNNFIFFAVAVVIVQVFSFNTCSAQEAYQNAMLDAHNELRLRHGAQPLTWDSTLQATAEDCAFYYAAKGATDHSCPYKSNSGENLYAEWGSNSEPNATSTGLNAISWWYAEIDNYNYVHPETSADPYLHYTQMVWKWTTSIGCAVSTQNYFTACCCLYTPQGNWENWNRGKDKYQFYKENVIPPSPNEFTTDVSHQNVIQDDTNKFEKS